MKNVNDAINEDKKSIPLFYHDRCDRYDYLMAVACGAVAGLVDIFLVGSPGSSDLGNWTDSQVDSVVKSFAKTQGWDPRAGQENNVKSAIGFLERNFKVNYDQRHSADVYNIFDMSTKNHHMKSLGHSPDIVGLFFSVLNQFTSTSSFISNGQLITIKTETFELEGSNFISKIFCGIVNWVGHIMSDVAGSSGAAGRGSGIAMPFYELFGLCNFGSFQVGQYRNTLATVATKAFQEGYDARFALTMAIPVVLCDLSIRLLWAIKHYFYHKRPLSECIPNDKHDDLRIMLILGHGTLCVMDGADAYIRSGGGANCVELLKSLNIIAWFRFSWLVLKEVCIRLGISYPLQKELEAFKRINEALGAYLAKLEKIDYKLYQKETERYNNLMKMKTITDENELNAFLLKEYKELGISLPYSGKFDEFMKDKTKRLEYK